MSRLGIGSDVTVRRNDREWQCHTQVLSYRSRRACSQTPSQRLSLLCFDIDRGTPRLVVGWVISSGQWEAYTPSADESNAELAYYLERVSRLPSQVRSSCENRIISALVPCGYVWSDVLEVEAICRHIETNHGLASMIT
jgi:hypothetical protein